MCLLGPLLGSDTNPDLQLGTESAWKCFPGNHCADMQGWERDACSLTQPAHNLLGTIPHGWVSTALLVSVFTQACVLARNSQGGQRGQVIGYQLCTNSPTFLCFVLVLGGQPCETLSHRTNKYPKPSDGMNSIFHSSQVELEETPGRSQL